MDLDADSNVTLARSCFGCIKSKRKCDRSLPRCKRCAARKRECVYKNAPACAAVTSMTALGSQDSTHPHGRIISKARTGLYGLNSPDSNNVDVVIMAFAAISLNSPQMDPPHVLMQWDEETFKYLRGQLMSIPETFVLTGGTLFIHLRLYPDGFPPLLQDTFALCNIHSHRTAGNQNIVRHSIVKIAADIVEAAASAHTFSAILEILQCLILLQIITLFFPTTSRIRELAERRLSLLHSQQNALYQHIPATLPSTLSPYQAWIVAESVRRSVHFCHKIQGVYSFQTKGYFHLTLFCESLPVNITSWLWDLDVSSGITQKSIENGSENVPESLTCQELISYRELTDRWEKGEMDNVGKFEELLLISCKGLEVKKRREDYANHLV